LTNFRGKFLTGWLVIRHNVFTQLAEHASCLVEVLTTSASWFCFQVWSCNAFTAAIKIQDMQLT